MDYSIDYRIENQNIIIFDKEKETLYKLFNCVLDTFLKVGLLDNDEPNELGFELEKLNDKINHEYVIINSDKK